MLHARNLAIAAAIAAAAPSAAQAEGTAVYQGKQITIVVGFTSGGTYDASARAAARQSAGEV
jgi:tripartite-type tricarboxylate transporter receptor subunit TctC